MRTPLAALALLATSVLNGGWAAQASTPPSPSAPEAASAPSPADAAPAPSAAGTAPAPSAPSMAPAPSQVTNVPEPSPADTVAPAPAGSPTPAGSLAPAVSRPPVARAPRDSPSASTPPPATTHTLAARTPTPSPKGAISGTILMLAKDGRVGAEGAIAYLGGAIAGSPPPTGPGPTMTMKDKKFTPRVLPVLAGTEVTFPNLDPVFHNVFSLSGKNKFDLGLYKDGASKVKRLEEPGVVRMFCNIHPGMLAYALVLENPYYAAVSSDGAFAIRGVPPGHYKLRVWHEKGGEADREIDVRDGATTKLEIELDARGYKVLPHKNKFGQDYSGAY